MKQRLRFLTTSSGLASIGMAGAVLCILGVFLSWYQVNIGQIGATGSVSGWSATNIARQLVAVSLLWGMGAFLLFADDLNHVRIDYRTAVRIAQACAVLAVIGVVLVVFRLMFPPEPTDFLTRDYGLFISVAGAVIGAYGCIGQAVRR